MKGWIDLFNYLHCFSILVSRKHVSRKHVARKHVSRKHVSRKYVSRKYASSANKSTANKYWSRILMRALARQWEFHEKREKWKIEKIERPGFERVTGRSLAWRLIHSAMEVLYDLEAEKLSIYSAQQRIIRSWNWSCLWVSNPRGPEKRPPYRSRMVLAHEWEWTPWVNEPLVWLIRLKIKK